MSEELHPGCKQAECEYPHGGRCLEGLDADDCPHSYVLRAESLVRTDERPQPAMDVVDIDFALAEDVPLHGGDVLDLHHAVAIAGAHPARLIILVGEQRCGKTTLLAELHQRFLRGPFAGQLFAGSRSLVGLERTCFLARTASNREQADTERTKDIAIKLVHLAVRSEKLEAPATHLLITDTSGERFRQARSNLDEARELVPLFKRADHILILVDGAKIANMGTRQRTIANARMLLRALLEVGALTSQIPICHAVTKWDAVVSVDDGGHAVESMRATIREQFQGTLPIDFLDIASRVEIDTVNVEPGHGLSALFERWAAPSEPPKHRPYTPASIGESIRSFARYGAAHRHKHKQEIKH